MDMYVQAAYDAAMTTRTPTARPSPADRIRAIAAGLNAAGITATTNGSSITGLDVTATSQPPGRATTEIMLDEDGYAEIRWHTNPTAPAADITTALTRILAAITATPSALAPTPRPGRDRSRRSPVGEGRRRSLPGTIRYRTLVGAPKPSGGLPLGPVAHGSRRAGPVKSACRRPCGTGHARLCDSPRPPHTAGAYRAEEEEWPQRCRNRAAHAPEIKRHKPARNAQFCAT